MILKFPIIDKTTLEDGSQRWVLDIEPHWFATVGFILESMEGYCIYTTVFEGKKQFLQLDIPPDYITEMEHALSEIEDYLERN